MERRRKWKMQPRRHCSREHADSFAPRRHRTVSYRYAEYKVGFALNEHQRHGQEAEENCKRRRAALLSQFGQGLIALPRQLPRQRRRKAADSAWTGGATVGEKRARDCQEPLAPKV